MRTFLRENALTLFFSGLLLLALVGQAASGLARLNDQQVTAGQDAISIGTYLLSSDFAADVAENWQSEFLAVASMASFAVYLRQRGSSESKPVGTPHDATGEEG